MIVPKDFIAPIPNYYYPITELVVPNISHYYFISTWGLIYNGLTHRILPQNIMYDKNKYITICVLLKDGSQKFIQPHRIVLNTFCYREDADQLEVNHLDGVKYHNWIWNLEWTTHSENMKYASDNNQFRLGENHQNSKLDNEIVIKICELIDQNYSNKQIKEKLNLDSYNCNIGKIITNIRLGLSWKNISRNYDFGSNY